GRTDVVHAVDHSNGVNLWRSLGNGTYAVVPFSPWAGYTVPNGVWLAADITNDGKVDIVHAVQGHDYVHPWLARWPRLGEASVDGLEVSQAVQSMDHRVTLFAAKQTWVRAYLSSGGLPGPGIPSVTVQGTLTVTKVGSSFSTKVNSANTVTLNPNQIGLLGPK